MGVSTWRNGGGAIEEMRGKKKLKRCEEVKRWSKLKMGRRN